MKATSRAKLQREVPGEVVLVIDDDPTVRMLVSEVLTDLGYAVMEAPDGPAGLKILRLRRLGSTC